MPRRQRTTTQLKEDFDYIMTSNTIHFAMVLHDLHPHLSLSFTSLSLQPPISLGLGPSVSRSRPSLGVLPSLSFSIPFPQSFSLVIIIISHYYLSPILICFSLIIICYSLSFLSIFLICPCGRPSIWKSTQGLLFWRITRLLPDTNMRHKRLGLQRLSTLQHSTHGRSRGLLMRHSRCQDLCDPNNTWNAHLLASVSLLHPTQTSLSLKTKISLTHSLILSRPFSLLCSNSLCLV